MENDMEKNDDQMDDEEETGTMKQWFQDNLRIIISIIIVIAIAGGIYSYSKRSAEPVTEDQTSQSAISDELGTTGNISDQSQAATTKPSTTEKTTKPTVQAAPAGQSQETDASFVETAARGESMTKLARRALANYLEKNPDSALTAEHKIYIEDYLRKNVAKKGIRVGTSVEFSKDLVNGAISKAKTLNTNQLKNLHKYAVRVPSLSW